MNARTIRRALERKAQRQARKESREQAQEPAQEQAMKTFPPAPGSSAGYPQEEESTPLPSEARLAANRENAQHSTGPKTALGRAVSSLNAVKTALTGRTVLLPSDDADRYQTHIQAFFDEIAPLGQRETLLAQSLADIAWRIERIASLEVAIYAKGRALLANTHADEPEAIRTALIELDLYQSNERDLRNLHLQEGRLRRQRDRDNEELRRLQAERRAAAKLELQIAAEAYRKAQSEGKPFDPAAHGFVFSTGDIETFIARRFVENTTPPGTKRKSTAA